RKVSLPRCELYGREEGMRSNLSPGTGSSFVPGGTRFVLARSPSDESLGYFRASLRDLGSRCILIRSNNPLARNPIGILANNRFGSRFNCLAGFRKKLRRISLWQTCSLMDKAIVNQNYEKNHR